MHNQVFLPRIKSYELWLWRLHRRVALIFRGVLGGDIGA